MSRWLPLLLACVLGACSGDLRPVKNTTVRVSAPRPDPESELTLKIFTRPDECGRIDDADLPLCLPWVDRSSGEVHLSFQFFDRSNPFYLPLTKKYLQVSHQGSVIQEGLNRQNYTVIPHDPIRTPQLFILLIDGSSSMNQPQRRPRIERLREALLDREVVNAFFPENVRTGVVLLQFIGDRVQPVGGELEVIERPKKYRRRVRQQLQAARGYTYLYDAVRHATGELLTEEAVKRFLLVSSASPTVIALTDGFNNQHHGDTCATNAPRLELLIEHLRNVRAPSAENRFRPQVYTVGLGRPFRPDFELPDGDRSVVPPRALCGGRYREKRIDGQLEKRGIDNASLTWIADAGGGTTYVKQDAGGLGEAFKAAAAEKYEWFELKYRVDPFHLRRSFETRLKLLAFATSSSEITIHPSGWLDAPPGEVGEDGWAQPTRLSRSTLLLMPALGLLVLLGYVSAAFFNARRVVFGRLRAPAPPPRGAGAEPSPPPSGGSPESSPPSGSPPPNPSG